MAENELAKKFADLFERFHTEIMVQTSRGCPGANFTEANNIYLEYYVLRNRRPTKRALDGRKRSAKSKSLNGKGGSKAARQ